MIFWNVYKSDLDVLWNYDPVEFNDNLLLSELSRTNTVTCKALAHKLYIWKWVFYDLTEAYHKTRVNILWLVIAFSSFQFSFFHVTEPNKYILTNPKKGVLYSLLLNQEQILTNILMLGNLVRFLDKPRTF